MANQVDGPAMLRYARKQKGQTQVEFAAAVGIPSTTLSKAESGKEKLSKEVVERIAAYTGMPYENLRGCVFGVKAYNPPADKPATTEVPEPAPGRWVDVVLPADVFAAIRERAEQSGRLVSAIIADIVAEYVNGGSRYDNQRQAIRKELDNVAASLKLAAEQTMNAFSALGR